MKKILKAIMFTDIVGIEVLEIHKDIIKMP